MKTTSITKRVFALLLCMAMIMSDLSGLFITAATALPARSSGDNKIADDDTMDTYIDALGIGTDTRNAGRVWADKSVFTGDITLDTKTDGINATVKNDSDFLHAFSAIGSTYEIEQDNVPLDVVFVLDFSGSMAVGINSHRLPATIEAVNTAINTLLEKSPNSRVGIVVYSSAAMELLPLTKLVPEPGVTNTQWLDNSQVSLSGGSVWFRGNGQRAKDEYSWENTVSMDKRVRIGEQLINPDNGYIGNQTNLQAGISLGMGMLAKAEYTRWYSYETEKLYDRTPAVIIMTDGQTNLLCGSNDSDQANAWWNTKESTRLNNSTSYGFEIDEEESGIVPIVLSNLMTASYNVSRIYDNYYPDNKSESTEGKHFYAYGISVETMPDAVAQQKTRAILDPGTFFNDSVELHESLPLVTRSETDELTSIARAYNKLDTWDGAETLVVGQVNGYSGDISLSSPSRAEKVYSLDTLKKNVNYIDSFYDIHAYDQTAVFDSIIKELINVNMFRPVGGDNDVNLTDTLTYMDPVGKYMEIKDIKNLLLFGKLYEVNKDGEPVYFNKDGSRVENADDINNRNYAYFEQYYRIISDIGDEVVNPCYSNEDHEFRFLLSNIKIYTKTTWDFRDPDIEDGNIRSDTGGDQSLYINIPVLALPVQKATIQLDAAGDINSYLTNLDDKTQSTPLRVFYTVGVSEAVKTEDGSVDLAKLNPDYVAANKADNGEVYLYSNWYNSEKDEYTHYITGEELPYTFGDAVITFSPDIDNSYYRYQSPLLIYDNATNERITSISSGGSYYIVTEYYTDRRTCERVRVERQGAAFGSGIGAAGFGEYLCLYNPETGDVQPYAENRVISGYYLAARQGGVSIGDMSQNIGEKSDAANKTKTSKTYYMPTISESTKGDVLVVNIYLGNNGRLSVTDSQLLVTKTLKQLNSDGMNIEGERFKYTIELGGDLANKSLSAIKVTEAGVDNWRAIIKTIELLTNNQGFLLKESGQLAAVEYNSAQYYVYVGGDSEQDRFTHTLFDNSDGSTLDVWLNGGSTGELTVTAYLLPINAYSTEWTFENNQSRLIEQSGFAVGNIDTERSIGYEVEIKDYQSTTVYDYEQLSFDESGRAVFYLRGGEAILLPGLDPMTEYIVTEELSGEQYDEKGVRLNSVIHKVSRSTTHIYDADGEPADDAHEFTDADDRHTYTVWGSTAAELRKEVHYCNYLPKAEKQMVSPENGIVSVGSEAVYVIYWENFLMDGYGEYTIPAEITITDPLDNGVDYVADSAEFVERVTNTVDGEEIVSYERIGSVPEGWEAVYDEQARTVIWHIPEAAPGASGYVRFKVTVNENAAFADDGTADDMISNTAAVTVNQSKITTNTVDTVVGEPHKTETEIKYPDGTVTEVGTECGNLVQDDESGSYVGPLVETGSEITYRIDFINYNDKPDTITVTDRLDPDVSFIRAWHGEVTLSDSNEDGTVTDGDTAISFDAETSTVKWTIKRFPPLGRGEVYLTVRVNDPNASSAASKRVFEKYDYAVLESGTYIIVNNDASQGNIALSNTIRQGYSNYMNGSSVEVNDNAITVNDDAEYEALADRMWDVEASGNQFYLKNVGSGKYLGLNSGSTQFVLNDSYTTSKWTNDNGKFKYGTGTVGGSSGTTYFIISGFFAQKMTFYKLKEADSGGDGEEDGHYAQKGDSMIHNMAQVKVGDNDPEDTEKIENPMHGSLIIEKKIVGAEPDDGRDFWFDITIVLPDGAKTDNIKVNGEALSWTTVGTRITGRFPLKGGQSIKIEGLPYNTEYIVNEDDDSKYPLEHIEINGEKYDAASGNISLPTTAVTFFNGTTPIAMPSTGGSGTARYYLLGAMLVIGAGLWLVIEKSKRKYFDR